MDTLIIKDLAASCRIGVFEWEQEQSQPIWIDLEVAIDAARAAAKDDVRDAVDYGRLVTLVKQHAEHHRFRLLETLAEGIAKLILNEFASTQVLVRVKKRALPGIDYAAVEVVRTEVSHAHSPG